MLTEYQLQIIGNAWVALTYLLIVSTVYWFQTKSPAKSAHGFVVIVAFAYAVVVSERTTFAPPDFYYWPMYVLLAVALASVLFSITAFKDERWRHFMHVGTLVAGFYVLLVGAMAISHDWV